MKTHTYSEIANDYTLWGQYVDTAGLDSREKFEAITEDEKIAMQVACFGAEEVAAHHTTAKPPTPVKPPAPKTKKPKPAPANPDPSRARRP